MAEVVVHLTDADVAVIGGGVVTSPAAGPHPTSVENWVRRVVAEAVDRQRDRLTPAREVMRRSVKIKSDHAANGPKGMSWAKPGAVVTVKIESDEDEAMVASLISQPGFELVKGDAPEVDDPGPVQVQPPHVPAPAPGTTHTSQTVQAASPTVEKPAVINVQPDKGDKPPAKK